jgi:hypothetical protein
VVVFPSTPQLQVFEGFPFFTPFAKDGLRRSNPRTFLSSFLDSTVLFPLCTYHPEKQPDFFFASNFGALALSFATGRVTQSKNPSSISSLAVNRHPEQRER